MLLLINDSEGPSHVAGPHHPESPERLAAVLRAAEYGEVRDAIIRREPRPATDEELERVHGRAVLDVLERVRGRTAQLDADTAVSPTSVDVARRAAGAGLTAIEELRRGSASAAFCAVRPPGHHATPDRSMGFCLLNNVAVTAAALAAAGERVLIADFDAHHGNGTQDVFWDDPRVLFVSWHQSPLYPGTGRVDEIGGAGAEGSTVNVPLPPGATGDAYRASFDDVVGPVVEEFAPTWVLVSAGFDAHRRDPLTEMGLTAGDYAELTAELVRLVPEHRTIAFLEGGYDVAALEASAAATMAALVDVRLLPEPPSSGGIDDSEVRRLVGDVVRSQGRR